MRTKRFYPYEEQGIKEDVRLVIYDRSSKEFIITKIIGSKEYIDIEIDQKYSLAELRYKYQIMKDNRWTDGKVKYSKLTDTDKKSIIEKLNFLHNGQEFFDFGLLDEVSQQDVKYIFKDLLLKTYDYILKNPTDAKIKLVKRFIDGFPQERIVGDDIIAHYHAQLYLTLEYLSQDFSLPLRFDEHKELEKFIKRSVSLYPYKQYNSNGVISGLLVASGNLYSQYNREKAYESYKEAQLIGREYIDLYLEVDAITTYYDDIKPALKNYEVIPYPLNSINPDNSTINLVFSADESYFKMFAVDWARTCYLFKNIHYNFGLVVTSRDRFNLLAKNFENIIASIAELTGSKIRANFSFYWIDCEVINKTQYACARFYLAEYLIKKDKLNLYITDIDQLVVGDIESYLEEVSKGNDVQLSVLDNYFQLIPGRCYMAGNIYLRNSDTSKKFIQLMVAYILSGIDEDQSWILDQNATRYAVEHVNFENINKNGKRPIHQFKNIKRLFRNGMLV